MPNHLISVRGNQPCHRIASEHERVVVLGRGARKSRCGRGRRNAEIVSEDRVYSGIRVLRDRHGSAVSGEPHQHPQPAGACHFADDAVENSEFVVDDEKTSALSHLVVVRRTRLIRVVQTLFLL